MTIVEESAERCGRRHQQGVVDRALESAPTLRRLTRVVITVEAAGFSPSLEEATIVTCESCGRAPARRITVRRHVGLLVMQQFVTTRVNACRPCGRRLIQSYTGRTLWQGWWGAISFFFNWFVLMANAWAWKRLGSIENPSLSGTLMTDVPRGFGNAGPSSADGTEQPTKPRSRLRRAGLVALLGFVALGIIGWGWDATHHDHSDPHGAPATAPMVERAMTGGAFTMDDGTTTNVRQATCAAEDETEAGAGGFYTHFRCQIAFDDGTSDEVIVHLLEDELFFKSTLSR
jgi:hypothetical protein